MTGIVIKESLVVKKSLELITTMKYDYKAVEAKWQKVWEDEKTFHVEIDHSKPKFYALVEFPYPSGAGLHVGHPRSYTALDVVSRKRRQNGYNVLYPMGWDAFGLPTENFAMKNHIHPAIVTKNNVDHFRSQLKALGFSFDWDREINTTDPIELTISWWGGDSRHEAYQKALEAFHEKYPNITVSPTYGAWSGWEEKQSTALAADQGSDVMQVNWNWLYQYSPTGDKFVDLREYSDIIDLSQWSDTAKNACIVADSLQAVPISMTGRIFYWNMNTFKQAGIEQVPASYDDLIAAGKAFQEKLGDDYYPLAIGQYDRMILMTFYLESKYGKAWVENNECQYSEEEIVDGLNFIDSLEDNHVIPTRPTMIAAGFDSIDKSQEWIDGKYAGIFEWDSAPSKYQSALADNSGFTVGEEIKFGDKANGGFSKVSMGMAITKSCQHPVEAAALIDFLWNGEGAAIMGSECGIPASTAGLASAQAADAVKPLVLEANTKVLAFVDMPLDPYYESSKLKDTTDGVYTDVFDGFSYGDYDAEEAAEILLDGVSGVLSANA